MWKIEQFRQKFGVMTQQYHDTVDMVREGKPATLPHDTPFQVNDNALTVIGHAKPVLKFLSFCLPVEDTFHIINYQGHVSGSVNVNLNILWTPEQDAQLDEAESLRDVKNLKTLDIQFEIPKCQNLPEKYASDIRCEFVLPEFVTNALLPEDGTEIKHPGGDIGVDDESEDPEDFIQRGGSYQTPFNPATEGQLIINPNVQLFVA